MRLLLSIITHTCLGAVVGAVVGVAVWKERKSRRRAEQWLRDDQERRRSEHVET